MEINIKLSASELLRGIQDGTLKAFIDGYAGDENAVTKGKAAAEAPKVTAPAPVAETATFNPTVTAPAPQTAAFDPMAISTPAPVPQEAPAPDPAPPVTQTAPPVTQTATTVTLEQVRSALAPAAKANKTAELAALFAEFGAQKLTDVAPENYAALIARAATL